MKEALCFDDVLLVPKYSEISSRSEVDISNSLDALDKLKFKLPIISSPMDTVTESEMATAMTNVGGLGIIHRYNSIEEQVELSKRVQGVSAAAIGVTGDYQERVSELYKAGVSVFCLDVAHGHHILVKNALKYLKNNYSGVHFMAGNVATLEGFEALADWGADSIRVGIGGGSICSTRLVSGHGIPTLQSVLDCVKTSHDVKIIADGGIKTSGDIVKAIAAGADSVMLGSLLAGTEESPGETVIYEGRKFKTYRGMGSVEAMQKGSKDRYFQSDQSDDKKLVPEGIVGRVPYKGQLNESIHQFVGGLRSGMGYCGSKDIESLKNSSKFVKITGSGIRESHPHNVSITKEAPNYSPPKL